MQNRLVLASIVMSVLTLFIGFTFSFKGNTLLPDQSRIEHLVDVKEINGEWRVVLADDESNSDVIARRGDRIIWVIEDSDATFTFPIRGIVGYRTRKVKAGTRLVLPVLNDSPLGEYDYTVYIEKSGTYARGQSPPRIIITN